MRFAFDDHHLALRDAVRALLDKECTPTDVRAAWETPTGRSPARWQALADMGVVGMCVPESHGGMGLDDIAVVLVIEEAGRVALPEPLGAVASVAASLLAEAAPEDVRSTWLPRLADGSSIVVAGLPGARYVEDAHQADFLLLADGDALHAARGEDVRTADAPALDRGRRRSTVTWTPSDRTLVTRHAAAAWAAAADRQGLVEAAYLVGTARACIDLATAYATRREQFSAVIGSFQAVKHALATALVKLEFARPAVYRAAWSVARGVDERHEHVELAHTLAAQAAHLAGRTSLQVHGAIGYTEEHDLHLWLRRALAPA